MGGYCDPSYYEDKSIDTIETELELCNAEDEREFDYAQGSEKGPGRWGELKKEWTACKNGEMQSPIDMSNQRVEIIRNSRKLEKDYKPCNATVKNRGHDIMLYSLSCATHEEPKKHHSHDLDWLAPLLPSALAPIKDQSSRNRFCDAEDEREFDYAQGGEKGPGRWGELKKEWAACKNGGMQSPVDMSNQRVEIIRGPEKLKRNYKPCNATFS
ncbi:hypothetical protein RJ640_024052 [Escallonia rubra]|uniref:Alpha-carbonic anhydrase domain-containing protein n=1 Tax=Escallonia rubra TaxID=112253 RepID=A0AA88QK94_9ASTE|nr:hypothetical protein RJ640_024052 [Escallonia rubra]